MSDKQPKEISIDWPPQRTIEYVLRDDKELDYVIPLERGGKEEKEVGE